MAQLVIDYDYLIKLIIVGNSGVGKSSLVHRFTRNEFDQNFVSTIGVDFEIREIEIDGKRIKLQCWDCAGNERFRAITTSYYRGALAIILAFDTTDHDSIQSIPDWIREIRQHNVDGNLILVGTKLDLWKKRTNKPFELSPNVLESIKRLEPSLMLDGGEHMILTSSKEDKNVELAFTHVTREYIKNHMPRKLNSTVHEKPITNHISLQKNTTHRNTNCCY